MPSKGWENRGSRLDLLAPGHARELRAAEKCVWCALLYFAALSVSLALFRILL